MASSHVPITVIIKIRWWVFPYLHALNFLAFAFGFYAIGMEVDVEKQIQKILKYGISVK